MNCSVNSSSLSVSCSATFKRDKSDLIRAANDNCKSSRFLAFDESTSSFSECNSHGSKCKMISGKCKPKPAIGTLKPGKPKPFQSDLIN